MPRFRAAPLSATGLLLAVLAAPLPAAADTPGPSGLAGAWGDDSSCTADVAVFRADGTVVLAGAAPAAPVTTYAVNGGTITLTQGKQSGTFAFAMTNQAVAWSNGSAMVLKERCADQTPFAAEMKSPGAATTAAPAAATATATATPAPAETRGPLFDRVKAMATAPLLFNGVPIRILGVDAEPARPLAKHGPVYGAVEARPDPQAVGPEARLLYRVFPSEAAAAAYVSLAQDQQESFVHEGEGAGFFSTASAKDEGPAGAHDAAVTIDCLSFHPKGQDRVTISCFAHMPGSPLVAGGEQSFPLAKGTKERDMGPEDDLKETLDLTGLAITEARGLLGQQPSQP